MKNLYRITIDEIIDKLISALKNGSFAPKSYLTEVFDRCYCHVMSSLRDTDRQIIVEMKWENGGYIYGHW